MAFHFLKRDLRRAWWLYLVWFLLYAAEGIFSVSTPPSLEGFWTTGAARQLIYFPVLHLLVLAILVPQLVHEDSPVGSTAFWLTRPVSRFSLLLCKVAGLGLAVLIPVAVNTAVLSRFGLSPGSLGLAAVWILAHQCSFVLPIAAVAALTPNFRWYGAVVVGMVVGIVVVLFVTSNGIGGSIATDPYANIALSNTRHVVDETLLILGGGIVFACQYLTRRTRRSMALASCFAGAYFLVAAYWPWSFGQVPPIHSEHAPFAPSRVTLEVIAAQLNGGVINGNSWKRIDGVCTLVDFPPDLYFQVRESKAQLRLADGTAIKTSSESPIYQPSFPFTGFSPSDSSAMAAALGGIPVFRYIVSPPGTTLAVVDNGAFQRFKDNPAKLVDDFDFVVGRYEVAAEVSIAKGRSFEVGSLQARIEDVTPRPDGVTLIVLESTVIVSPGFTIRLGEYARDPRLRGDPVYLLVNRARREAVPFGTSVTRSSVGEFYLSGMLFQETVQMPFGGGDDPHAPVLDKQWLADATLVCLERVPTFEFRKSAEINLPKLGEPWLSIQSLGTQPALSNEVSTATPSKEKIVIGVDKDGTVTVDGKRVSDDQLSIVILRAHQTNEAVLITASEGANPKRLAYVMEACRAAGVDRLSLQSR